MEIEKIKSIFTINDKDNDGYLKNDEIILIFKKIGLEMNEDKILEYIKLVSTDENKINFNNFCKLIEKITENRVKNEALVNAFKVLDRKNNNEIDILELKYLLKNLGNSISNEDIDSLISIINPNSKSKVNINDAVELLKS